MIVPVILSGGTGTRLWPLSRELYPKQLIPLSCDQTMLQDTVKRLEGFPGLTAPIIVCNESHRFMVAERLLRIGCQSAAILLEPVGRNTAPAVAVAAFQAMSAGNDPILLVLPADHVVLQPEKLQSAISKLLPYAENGKLGTLGVVPTGPETSYGYIHVDRSNCGVLEFVEKPNIERARDYLTSGDYYWNSGIFMFRASRYLRELERWAPVMLAACRRAWERSVRDLDFTRLESTTFVACPADSIDYAVMEKTADAVMLPLDAGWNDVGSWSALWEVGQHDQSGNVVVGDVLTVGARNCYLHAQSRLLAAVGVEDLVVVETVDAVLVARRDRVQDVREVVALLKQQQRPEAMLHRKVFRPWGNYQLIDSAERFQVKRITVNPGSRLSLQMHQHRAEHWVVVKGTARITRGEEDFTLNENQSTYIPLGVHHRLENPGRTPLELIEVQSGSYLEEEDIIRFEDIYGR